MDKIFESWFLLQFKPRAHRVAEKNLNRQGFKTFLPLKEVTQRKRTRFTNELRPLFDGYMFVNFEMRKSPWRKINSTIGVSKLVSFGGRPKAVPFELVSSLKKRCDTFGKLLPSTELKKHDEVEVLTGPFANFIGKIEEIDTQQRVWVLIELMGQSTRFSVAHAHVESTKKIRSNVRQT